MVAKLITRVRVTKFLASKPLFKTLYNKLIFIILQFIKIPIDLTC